MSGGKTWEDGSYGEKDEGQRAHGCYDLYQSSCKNDGFPLCIK